MEVKTIVSRLVEMAEWCLDNEYCIPLDWCNDLLKAAETILELSRQLSKTQASGNTEEGQQRYTTTVATELNRILTDKNYAEAWYKNLEGRGIKE